MSEQQEKPKLRVLGFWVEPDPCTDPSECFWMEGERYEGEICGRCGATADGKGGLFLPEEN